MTIAGTQQDLAPAADAVRQVVAGVAGAPVENVYW